MKVVVQEILLKDISLYKFIQLSIQKIYAYLVLFKLKLSVLVLFTAIIGFWLGIQKNIYSNTIPLSIFFLNFVLGLLCIICGANGFNQIIERNYDRLMKRTSTRPLLTGIIELKEATIASFFISLIGFILLLYKVNFITTILGLLAFFTYLFIYTPLKRKSLWCTTVGAIAGALPIVMGQTAITNKLDTTSILLFMLLFLWQFPHFFTIGFIYKEEYAKAGFKILPVKDTSGKKTATATILSSIALIILSFLTVSIHMGGNIYLIGSIFLGIILLFRTIDFYKNITQESAYNLLCTSFLYLPIILILIVCDKL